MEETEQEFEKDFKQLFGTPEDEQKAAAALAHAEAQVRRLFPHLESIQLNFVFTRFPIISVKLANL